MKSFRPEDHTTTKEKIMDLFGLRQKLVYDPTETIPEHKKFQKKTSITMAAIFLIAAAMGLAGAFCESMSKPWIETIFSTGFIISVALFMAYGLYRVTIAKPDCPKCGRYIKRKGNTVEVQNTQWRVFECPACSHKFKIPGFSSD